jgi:hypothetical protein
MTGVAASERVSPDPYPGPRPFTREDASVFFGRTGEILDLTDLLLTQRSVVLYAQSGAGKTSLIQAGVLPRLPPEWRVRCGRVGGRPSAAGDSVLAKNIFTRNLLETAGGIAGAGLTSLVADGGGCPTLIIFDQFEELFTTHTDRWRDRERFFRELAEAAAAQPAARFLFVMREEHVARLQAFSRWAPDGFRTRYCLERLRQKAAVEAITRPAEAHGRPFTVEAAQQLAGELLREVAYGEGTPREVEGEFVEPLQLQLVCKRIWDLLEAAGHCGEITSEEIRRFGRVDETLQAYYERTLSSVAREARVRDATLRDWFDRQLITPLGTRGLALVEPGSGAVNPSAVRALEERHLVRCETRAGAEWCELSHDRLIAPIRASNARSRIRRRRRSFAVIAVLLVLLAAASIASLRLYRKQVDLARELDKLYTWSDGEVLNAAYALLAWRGLTSGDDAAAMRAADDCIREFGQQARAQQNEAERRGLPLPGIGTLSPTEVRQMAAHRILNNVAGCYYVKAKVAERSGRPREAREQYRIVQSLTYGRVWNDEGFFWSPAAGAAEALRTLPE